MMKNTTLALLTLLLTLTAFGQTDSLSAVPDTINQRIFLIGDAGDMNTETHPIIAWLKKNVDWNDERNAVIFLGDNIYPLGLPMKGDPTYRHSKAILDDQMSLVKGKKGKAFFIPGNHDWRNGKLGGWEQVMNQQDYINSQNQKNVQAWPLNGCPGPIQIELSDKVVVVLIDSQWFLYLHDKPGPGSNCDAKTIDEFAVELAEIAATHPNQMLVLATHHPLYSYGIHGGDFTWKEHIFPFTALNPKLYIPLPVIGSVYPLTRGVFGSVQDIPHPLYKTMINTIEDVLKKHPYPVAVAGHDHGLQYIFKDSIPYIISGAGSKLTRTRPGRFEVFSDVSIGFSVIEVWKSGKSDVKYYNMSSADFNAPTFTAQLKTIQPPPPAAIDTTRAIFDSVVVVAANPNLYGTGFRNFMVGSNYRREWVKPLRVKVLDMGSDMGGLFPIRQGGGKQTKSLRLQDSTGKQWTLRSIAKNPEAALPADLRQSSFITDVVADGISAAYPYGALSMETFSRAAGIPYLRTRLVYLPDDPRLLRFRSNFKNTMALLEEREPAGVKNTDNTDDLVLKLDKDNDNHVDQKAVLRARLLDNFVMDFDRHEGQWAWATRDTGRGKIYYPIPRDRDQVFFLNQGVIPWFVRRPWLVPELQGFRAHAINIKTFNRTARNFDHTFLTELTESDWKRSIDTFLSTMTDNVIETALHRQPAEMRNYGADKIISTLKERRKYFAGEMIDYYRYLSRNVTIVGTNQREQFDITKNEDGSVRVVIHKIARSGELSSKIYDRLFDPEVTRELAIFGLDDDDRFIVAGPNSKIKVRLIGGGGNDEFINNGEGKKVMVYDVTFEENKFSGTTAFRKRVYADPQTNRYSRLNFKYNLFRPRGRLEYNVDEGLVLGPRLEYSKPGFQKEPYSIRQYLEAYHSFRTSSYRFVYEGDFVKAFRNNDILLRADVRTPNVANFFGLGNNTERINRPDQWNYYRARYTIINTSAYLSHQLQSWMHLNFGPTFQYFKVDSSRNHGRFVTDPSINGIDESTAFRDRHYLGADARIVIDSRNNPVLPTRGLTLDAGVRQLFGLDATKNSLTQLNVDMRIFMNLFTFPRFVLGTRFGWAKNYGTFEFPQAQYLGGTENLRGFRKQRFAGRSMLYNNLELRFRLADFNTYLFGGTFGLLVFNDVGRVFVREENSSRWHDGYGGGVWFSPIRRFVITATVAHSNEESAIPRIAFGFQF